jgi:hypothetical protein
LVNADWETRDSLSNLGAPQAEYSAIAPLRLLANSGCKRLPRSGFRTPSQA